MDNYFIQNYKRIGLFYICNKHLIQPQFYTILQIPKKVIIQKLTSKALRVNYPKSSSFGYLHKRGKKPSHNTKRIK